MTHETATHPQVRITTVPLGPLRTNCYIVQRTGTDRAFVVDPGLRPSRVLELLQGLQVAMILLTHCHWDHIAGLEAVQAATGAPIYVHEAEREWPLNPDLNRSVFREQWFPDGPITGPAPDRLLRDGDQIAFADLQIRCHHTPGHTPGGTCYEVDGCLFTGDSLFAGTIGRTDLPDGDHAALINSIRDKLFVLDPATAVYPGHGRATTTGVERETNPFFAAPGRMPY